jgi:hypothetical protein
MKADLNTMDGKLYRKITLSRRGTDPKPLHLASQTGFSKLQVKIKRNQNIHNTVSLFFNIEADLNMVHWTLNKKFKFKFKADLNIVDGKLYSKNNTQFHNPLQWASRTGVSTLQVRFHRNTDLHGMVSIFYNMKADLNTMYGEFFSKITQMCRP